MDRKAGDIMERYTRYFERSFEIFCDEIEQKEKSAAKYEFAEELFGLVTCDEYLAKIMVDEIISIIKVILRKENFKFMDESKKNYHLFIRTINLPFLRENIEWGTSVRGCWFSNDYHTDITFPLVCYQISVGPGKIEIFMQDLIEWWDKLDG